MSIGFPTNIVSLILVASIATAIAFWLSLSQGLAQVRMTPLKKGIWRVTAASVLIGWLLVYLSLAVNPPGGTVLPSSITVPFLVLGTLGGILPFVVSPVFRQIVRASPATWIVGVHAVRTFGSIWFALADMKLLPPEFAIPAGIGDMTVGLLALWMVYLLAQQKPYARAFVIGWNLVGVADFMLALTTGLMYIRPYAAHVAAAGISTLYLNYVFLIPTFAIPLLVALHVYSLAQMISGRRERTRHGSEAVDQPAVLA
jgi:hypothetical protein